MTSRSAPLDPIATSSRIEDDYRSYLLTTFHVADADLRRELEERLREDGRIRRGPIVQATPPYRPGRTLRALVDEGVLHSDLLRHDEAVLPPDRPLYAHQEEALRALRAGRNLIVATGTGSGKTECYLLPVLDHLLRERDAGTVGEAGVRALLLYPMNALANDQMARIRDLFAPYPELTFGRYVGDTEHDPGKALESYRQQHGGADPLPNELIDRQSMKDAPPHVLLTNYAMLEYLLLRPADSPFFDGPTGRHWRFVVLDEVHVYDGARGAELGMLLRRVRDRVHASERGRLQCIGTSATLGRGAEDAPAVAAFARELFDEAFAADDVVLPQRLPLRHGESEWKLTPAALDELHARWRQGADADELIAAVAECLQAPPSRSFDRPEAALHELLRTEHHVVEVQHALESGSKELHAVADVMDGFPDPARAVVKLVDLCIAARPDERSASLVPARYHLFLRASEGAYVCWSGDHPADQPRLVLDRHQVCPACAGVGGESRMFELAFCRHCGVDYAVGTLENGRLVHAPAHQRHLVHVLRDPATVDDEALDEDEVAVTGSIDESSAQAHLCLRCGALGDRKPGCDCTGAAAVPVRYHKARAGEELRRCLACGRHSTVSVTMRFQSGSEAPVSVIATSLYQSLPPAPQPDRRALAGGRKLLMFSDSRQDAAFFAPYLQRTYMRAIERRCIWAVLGADDEPFRLEDLVQPVRRYAEKAGVLDEDDGRANASKVRTWLLAEVLATDRRQSLDGLGLAEISPRIPARLDPPSALARLGLSDDEALDLTRLLLDTVRVSAAVGVPDDVNVREDLRFAPRNTTTRLREQGAEQGVLAWLPGRGLNRRLDLVQKVAGARGVDVDPVAVLGDLWREITHPDSPLASVLRAQDEPRRGTVYRLDPEQIEFAANRPGHRPFRCDRCHQLWWRSVAGVCPTYRCDGRLHPEEEPSPNHYRALYEKLEPIPIRVEEHTGQLRTKHATDLQGQFVRGEVNALSCSTTFELGVDVGEVQAVLMRNVPPSAANYVQRAGRAGRRLGSAALVVTFAQRRSHDLHFFENPAAMVDGHVRPPIAVVDNEAIARRHVHAVAWSMFERRRADVGQPETKSVEQLVGGGGGGSVAEEFLAWLRERPGELRTSLERILPSSVVEALGVRQWAWVDLLADRNDEGVGGWLGDSVAETRRDLAEIDELIEEAAAERKYRRADAMQRTRKTVAERRVLDFLAQRGVLPKYGFPVDVVDLDLSRSETAAETIELNRDLRMAVLEFAPGARVVAANHLWRSTGIRLPAGKQLPVWAWGICDGCGVLRSRMIPPDVPPGEEFEEPCHHCGSDAFASGRRGRYVIPLFGFVGEKDAAEPGETRPPREGFLETYFAEFDGPPPRAEVVELGGAPITVRASRRGWITVFNRGRTGHGFTFCPSCGYATDEPVKRTRGRRPEHPRPHGGDRTCSGATRRIDLGHRYLTNVMELELPLSASPYDTDTTALSALHGLLAAAPAVGVSQQDVGGSLSVGPTGARTIVVYDEVPGGAGHTRYLKDHLADLVDGAIRRLERCGCGLDTSCYGCLRTYGNQRDHERLVRRAALDVLGAVV